MKVNIVIILRDDFTWHKGEGFLPPRAPKDTSLAADWATLVK